MAISAADKERVRELSARMSDVLAGQEMGWPPWKVQQVRKELGVPAYPRNGWTAERYEELHRLYIVEGRSAIEVAEAVGTRPNVVRTLVAKKGWKRDRAFHVAHMTRANRKRYADRPKKEPPVREPALRRVWVAKPIPTRFVSASDTDLIAAFLAEREVTVCDPGTAAGLSFMERMFTAAPPAAALSMRDRCKAYRKARAA